MENAKPAVLAAIVVALAVGWAARWEVVAPSQGVVIYMVNRWTGDVRVVRPTAWEPVSESVRP